MSINAYKHVLAYIHVCIYLDTYIHMYLYRNLHRIYFTNMQTYIHAWVHTCMAYVHTYTQICVDKYIPIYRYTYCINTRRFVQRSICVYSFFWNLMVWPSSILRRNRAPSLNRRDRIHQRRRCHVCSSERGFRPCHPSQAERIHRKFQYQVLSAAVELHILRWWWWTTNAGMISELQTRIIQILIHQLYSLRRRKLLKRLQSRFCSLSTSVV